MARPTGIGAFALHFTSKEIAVLTFDEGDNGRAALSSAHEIGFPITGALAPVDDLGALFDADPSGQETALAVGITTATSFAVRPAQMGIQRAVYAFVRIDKGVEGLMRNAHRRITAMVETHRPCDLFGRPILHEFALYILT